MPTVGTVTLDPFEFFPVTVGFAAELSDGETISNPSASAINKNTGVDSSSIVLLGTPSVDGPNIVQKVKGSASGEKHVVSIIAETSQGNAWVGKVVLKMKA